MTDFDERIVAEFREHGGVVETRGFGKGLVLVHTVGARTGEERIIPLVAMRVDSTWLVLASAGGSPTHPAWYHNLVAQPEVSLEVPGPDGAGEVATVDVLAVDLQGEDYDAARQRFVDRSATFTQMEQKAGRRVPIIRFEPRA